MPTHGDVGITLRFNKEEGAGKEQAGPLTKGAESQVFWKNQNIIEKKSKKRFPAQP